MALKYCDYAGTYRIIKHRDETATLVCRDRYGRLTNKKTYKNEHGAKRALSKFCGGLRDLEKIERGRKNGDK